MIGAGQDVARSNLAALTQSGAVLPWAPDPNGTVEALAVTDQAVIAGGAFTAIGGVPREYVAALPPPNLVPTGAPFAFSASRAFPTGTLPAQTPPRVVRAVGLSGTSVYVGGTFTAIGGVRRSSLAAIDLATGRATSWAPPLTNGTLAPERVRAGPHRHHALCRRELRRRGR